MSKRETKSGHKCIYVSVPDSSLFVLNWKIMAKGKTKSMKKIILDIQAMTLAFHEQHFTSCSN